MFFPPKIILISRLNYIHNVSTYKKRKFGCVLLLPVAFTVLQDRSRSWPALPIPGLQQIQTKGVPVFNRSCFQETTGLFPTFLQCSKYSFSPALTISISSHFEPNIRKLTLSVSSAVTCAYRRSCHAQYSLLHTAVPYSFTPPILLDTHTMKYVYKLTRCTKFLWLHFIFY